MIQPTRKNTTSQPTNMSTNTTTIHTPTRTAETERLVNRLKNSNPDKFESMVKMHLSFLLDLSGSQLEEFLDPEVLSGPVTLDARARLMGFTFSKKRALKDKEKACGRSVFGAALAQQSIELIFPLIEYLHRPECLAEEGLFRKSGHASRQRQLQDSVATVSQMEALERELEGGVYTAHDCASIIKIFLRELPEPLLTNRHYVAYCQIPGMKSHTKQLHSIQLLLQLLPQPNYILLQLLVHLLHRVALEPSNKMTADTLATLFAPHVLVPRSTHAHDLHAQSTGVTKVVAFMIQHFRVIFMPPEPLVRDIRLYWDEMEGANQSALSASCDGVMSEDELDACTCPRFKRKLSPCDDAIRTAVCFADREASVASTDFTHSQVAQLYAYVSAMPDSPRKRKLVKQFNKHSHSTGTGTPQLPSCDKHKRCLTDSIKKMIVPTPRRNSYDVTKEENTPRSEKKLSIGTPLHMSGCRLRQKHLLRHEKLNTSTDTEISVTSSLSSNSDSHHSSMPLLNDVTMTPPLCTDSHTNVTSGLNRISHELPHCKMELNFASESKVCVMDTTTSKTEVCSMESMCSKDKAASLGDKYISDFGSFLHNASPIPCISDMEDKENASSAFKLCAFEKSQFDSQPMEKCSPKLKHVKNNNVISRSAPTLSKPIRT